MKRFAFFLFYSCFSFSISSESIRYQVDGYEFYFLRNSNTYSESRGREIIQNFADKFVSELIQESERLNIKKPSEALVFIAENPSVFAKTSGQPSFVAGRFLPESNRFYFQNPNTLDKKNILVQTVRHEICHFLSPHIRDEHLQWLEESYCEALYPTNAILPKRLLVFPKSWEKFKKIHSGSNLKRKAQLEKYKLLSSWGNWILKERGEIRFRNMLDPSSTEKEWKLLYSEFLKSKSF